MISIKDGEKLFRLCRNLFKKTLIFLILVLYIIFLYMDFYNKRLFISSNNAKFISILLCFIIAILDGISKGITRDISLLQGGLFLTLIADYIFLIYNKGFPIAIGLFIVVQILYIIRYSRGKTLPKFIFLIISFLIISTIHLYINLFIREVDIIIPMAVFYGICLLLSLRESIIAYKNNVYPSPNRELILIGMILFLLCDINVGLYNILKGPFIFIWLFYLPSQLLLALSGYGRDKFNRQ